MTYKVRHSHGHYVAQYDSPEKAQAEADRLHRIDEERRARNHGVWSTHYAVDVISEVYTTRRDPIPGEVLPVKLASLVEEEIAKAADNRESAPRVL